MNRAGKMNTSFFGELLQAISERGRLLIDRARERRDSPAETTESLADCARARDSHAL